MIPSEYDALIDEAYPTSFQQGLVRAVFAARELAWEDTQKFEPPEAENARPTVARAFLEGLLRGVAGRHETLTVSIERASNWNHTEVRGGRLVLTQNSVPVPCGIIDFSNFRGELAKDNNALTLFGEPEPDPAEFLTVLLHSQYRSIDRDEQQRFGHLAGSAYLVVPSADQKRYLHRVNLVDKLPEVVRSLLPQEWIDAAVVSYLARARRTGTA